MAGIYIHIPFCKQACHYCDFHFTTRLKNRNEFVDCLLKEIELQKNYLGNEKVKTIYFGGGTPSLLNKNDLDRIFEKLNQQFLITPEAEITLEANPDDLNAETISNLKSAGVNRLSVGIQSFFDKDLQWMNRAHNAGQSLESVKLSQDAGFSNISVDLIYGLPNSTNEEWEENLSRAFELNVQHLSCYCLTVEPKTALASFIKTGKSKNVNEEQAATQFEILMEKANASGWEHYEISNFCRKNFHSRHNASYWSGEKYLGLGPSAHSFNGISRQWNVSNNQHYFEAIKKGILPFESETLTVTQRLNEYVMTSLRTMWGCDLKKVGEDFGQPFSSSLKENAKRFEEKESVKFSDDKIILTGKGKLIADRIILELIFDEQVNE